jgi:REP element-mobilizing transposase RayT
VSIRLAGDFAQRYHNAGISIGSWNRGQSFPHPATIPIRAETNVSGFKMARRKQRQLCLPSPPTWGGARDGAGRRPRAGRPSMPHDRRPAHDPHLPVQVTMRCRPGIPSLRSPFVFAATKNAIASSSHLDFRVLHCSVQQDHLHLIVEADTHVALQRRIKGLAVRITLAVNRATHRRGRLWSDRYHTRALTTPREVRTSLVYVLQNF